MVRVDGHYPVVVVKVTRALKPFQTSELDLGLLVILAATPCWCPARDLNPEETDFESAVSANCTNRTNKNGTRGGTRTLKTRILSPVHMPILLRGHVWYPRSDLNREYTGSGPAASAVPPQGYLSRKMYNFGDTWGT